MKVVAVTEQFEHHNVNSSPDYLTNFIQYEKVIQLKKGYPIYRQESSFNKFLSKLLVKYSGMGGYREFCFYKEMNAVFKTFLRKYLVHFYAGDAGYRYFQALNLKNKVIATYHQPPELFHNFIQEGKDKHIYKLDAILFTSQTLSDFLSKYIDRERLFYLPLPIDTKTFIPIEREENHKKICLFLGQWQRDFETMSKVINNLKDNNNIEFHIITFDRNKKFFNTGLKNIKFFSNIPFSQYLNKLQNGDALVLPFKNCTSNLAVLESMSVGLPIITTNIGGINDYVNDSFAILKEKGDDKGIADAVVDLMSNESNRVKMGENARLHATKHFDFPVIAEKLKDIYKKLGATHI